MPDGCSALGEHFREERAVTSSRLSLDAEQTDRAGDAQLCQESSGIELGEAFLHIRRLERRPKSCAVALRDTHRLVDDVLRSTNRRARGQVESMPVPDAELTQLRLQTHAVDE